MNYSNTPLQALGMLARLFRYGATSYHGGLVNLATGQVTPLPLNTDTWKRIGKPKLSSEGRMTFEDPKLFDKAAEALLGHLEHPIAITAYGGDAAPDNIAIECEHCRTVLIDFLPEPEKPTNVVLNPVAAASPIPLVVEFHYRDGDIGAHRDNSVAGLWAQFAKGHGPSHIVIRPESGK